MAIFDIDGIESRIGYTFKDKMLLRKCFTHASYGYEHGEENNEVLEFFGDAIIEFVVTEYLYKNASGDEGKLTEKRAKVVSREPLLNAVVALGLHNFVLLGKGLENNKNLDVKLYSSIYEALVAGIYLDGGLVPTKKFIKNTIIADFERLRDREKRSQPKKDAGAKGAYQEYVQKRRLGSVGYEMLNKFGPDHKPSFRVAALLNGTRLAEGVGVSKKLAEAEAAEKALAKLIEKERSNENF